MCSYFQVHGTRKCIAVEYVTYEQVTFDFVIRKASNFYFICSSLVHFS